MTLRERYVEYLRSDGAGSIGSLAVALSDAYPFEAKLLAGYDAHGEGLIAIDDATWNDRGDVFVGSRPPPAESAGQLWFDTVELAAMVLVPREPPADDWHPDAVARWTPFVGWLSLRPVARWQFAGYLALTDAAARAVGGTGFVAYDPARLAGAESPFEDAEPITRLTCVEALHGAQWFGKQLPTQMLWQSARDWRPGAVARLWNGSMREWIEWPDVDDDESRAISSRTIDADPVEERRREALPPPDERTLYRYSNWSRNCGFRSAILFEVGLYDATAVGGVRARP